MKKITPSGGASSPSQNSWLNSHDVMLQLLLVLLLLIVGRGATYAQSCNCTEYIYLNEPSIGAVLKFEVGASVPLTEVLGANGGTLPAQHWYPGTGASELPSPHGLATDLNGNLYIGANGENSLIRQFDCDGIIEPVGPTTILNSGYNQNIFSIGNTIYVNTDGGPSAYNSCTGTFLGQLCLNGASGNLWGLSYNPVTELVYVSERNDNNEVWVFTRAQLEAGIAGSGVCIDPLTTVPTRPRNGEPFGIVGDNDGNFYVVRSGSTIFKFNAAGVVIDEVDIQTTAGSPAGAVWSADFNRLYVSNLTGTPGEDCISVIDASTMTYLGAGAVNALIGATGSKAIGILKECCPVNLPASFNKDVCGAVGTKFYLNEEAFNTCDGIVCGSSWTPTSLNGMTFDACDNSVTVTGDGCSTFTLNIGAVSSTGCGAQSSTFTICNSTTPSVVTATPSTCNPADNSYSVSGQVTISVPPATGTLTVSVTGGGSQVFNAPFTSPIAYNITGLNSGGASQTVTATFSDAASCTATTTYTAPAACVPEGSCNCTEYIYLNEPVISSVLKFEVGNSILLSEVVGANGGTPPLQHWYPGLGTSEIPDPHGLATDLNGNLYIGANSGAPTTLRQFDCDGTISPIGPNTIIDNDAGIFNMFSIGNLIYKSGNGTIRVFNSCSGALIGEKCLNGGGNGTYWGLSYNAVTETVYASNNTGQIWKMTLEELNDFTTCEDPFIVMGTDPVVNPGQNALPFSTVNPYYGIVGDNSGNIYIVKTGIFSGNTTSILKYGANGQFVSQAPESPANGSYGGAIGIIWSENTNRLFVSNFTDSPATDCISAFDANTMTYLGTAAPNPNLPTNNTAKAIAIIKECCPVNLPTTFTKNVCGNVGEKFFLNQEAFDTCDGIVCGSSWVPTSLNGMTFDPCDNSVTITGASGCSTFTLDIGAVSSTGCGAVSSTFTICNSSPPTVVTTSLNCTSATEYSISGQVTIANPPATGTMTVMDSQGSSQVFSAPFTSPIAYSIAGLVKDGAVHTVSVSFSDAVTCAANTTYTAPRFEAVEAGVATTICQTGNVVLANLGASVTPVGLPAVWTTSGDGTFTGGSAFSAATAYVPGPNDIANGTVTLTLTSNDPSSVCPAVSDSVTITILRANCGTFPWDGN